MIVIGQLEDQLNLLVWAQISNSPFSIANPSIASFSLYQHIFVGLLNPLLTNQPLIWSVLSLGLSLFGVNFYNFFILVSTGLNCFFSLKLLARFPKFKYLGLLIAFSSFFWIHLGRHVVEQQIWVFPLLMYIYLRAKDNNFSLKYNIYLIGTLTLSTLISNYFGFFNILFYFFLAFFSALTVNNILLIKKHLFSMLMVLSGTALLLVVFLYPFISANYLNKQTSSQDQIVGRKLHRPYEDFFTFSIRPWYLVIPPIGNPIFGDFAKNTLDKIKNTNYFLADDYFAGEHSGNFIGIILLSVTTILAIITFLKGPRETKAHIFAIVATKLTLFSMALPPFFTINGIEIYTPGFLIYKYFPMFRTTSRMSILLTILTVYLLSFCLRELTKYGKLSHKTARIIGACVFVITLISNFIPPRVQVFEVIPEHVKYLSDAIVAPAKIAAYPYNTTDELMFWLPHHKKLILNPRGYNAFNFNSEEFTKNLVTPNGIIDFVELGGEYLVINKSVTTQDLDFFMTNPNLSFEIETAEAFIFKSNYQNFALSK